MIRTISLELLPPPRAWSAPRASQLLSGARLIKALKLGECKLVKVPPG